MKRDVSNHILSIQGQLKILAIAFVILNVLDILVTLNQVSSGAATEVNPIMSAIINHSAWFSILYKVVLAVMVSTLLILASQRYERFALSTLRLLVGCIAGVCMFNIVGVIL
jgi:hypothetical protein